MLPLYFHLQFCNDRHIITLRVCIYTLLYICNTFRKHLLYLSKTQTCILLGPSLSALTVQTVSKSHPIFSSICEAFSSCFLLFISCYVGVAFAERGCTSMSLLSWNRTGRPDVISSKIVSERPCRTAYPGLVCLSVRCCAYIL